MACALTCGAVVEAPCGGGAGLGRDRLRADPAARWRALGRARARLVVKAAGGRRRGAVVRRGPGTLGLGWLEPRNRGPLDGTLVARARRWNGWQGPDTHAWGTDGL